MIPTTYKFRFPQDRNFDQYVAYALKHLEQLSSWQNRRIRFSQFQLKILNPTQHDLNLDTNTNDIITAPSVKKLQDETYQFFS